LPSINIYDYSRNRLGPSPSKSRFVLLTRLVVDEKEGEKDDESPNPVQNT
jgi:hypothetical protein